MRTKKTFCIRSVFLKSLLLTSVFLASLLLTSCGAWGKEAAQAVMSQAVTTDTADGILAEQLEQDKEQILEALKEPIKVKGIYVTGPVAGIDKMEELITLVEETELNAMVIDIKNDTGVVTYKMHTPVVEEIGAAVGYISDIETLIQRLKEKDIYLIARIVAFKDPYLAEQKPELSLYTQTGEVFRDRNGEAWVNPYQKEVWDYLMEIGTEVAAVGFDEIQFDYIRFTTDTKAADIDYGEEALQKSKEEVITEFTKYAYDTLSPLGVAVSADVFGTIIDNQVDAAIVGQNYEDMASNLDAICPMVYPSHYQNGAYGIPVPDKAPYDTVYKAMSASKEKLASQETQVRVWLQDFTASWLPEYASYGETEIRAQIQAVYDAGYEEWILWNARMNYTKDALLPEEETQKEKILPEAKTEEEAVEEEIKE